MYTNSHTELYQGRIEVYFSSFIPCFYPNFLSLIPKVMRILIPDPAQNLLIPEDELFKILSGGYQNVITADNDLANAKSN